MRNLINRRSFLALSGAGVIAHASAISLQAQSKLRPLPIPALMDLTDEITGRIPLLLWQSTHDFGTGIASQTYGINQSYLGPVLKVKSGQTLPFDVTNNIGDIATLHWHGLHIPGDVDGGPHQEIEPGQTWQPNVPIVQRASTNWFHSHTHGKTARQTYNGLAGVMHIEDEGSLAADLPKSYGVDDYTLILQDKTFDAAGRMSYRLAGDTFENGFQGDTLVVNGAIAPVGQTVPSGLVRLRILNACNARFLDLSLSGNTPLTVIASDGGFLSSAVQTSSITMAPGERYEILIDMNTVSTADLMVAFAEEENEGFFNGLFGGNTEVTALRLIRDGNEKGFSGTMPNALAILAPANRNDAIRTRSFELNMGDGDELAALAVAWGNVCGNAGGMGINGRPMNMDRIDEGIRKGDTEIWRIQVGEQRHPFHIHGCSFRILTQQGTKPPSYAQGWKDMVAVQEGWSEVLVRFDHEATESNPFMYHCHILEHEDCGMMGQFTVGDARPFSLPAIGGENGEGDDGGNHGND